MNTRRQFLLSSAAALTLDPLSIPVAFAAPGPNFKLFDAHAHLKSEDLQRYARVVGQPAPAGAPPGAGPALPVGSEISPTPEVDRVLRWMDENGVAAGAAVQHRGTYGYDNSYILDSADLHPDRLKPVVVLNAEDPKTPDLMHALAIGHGLAGVRLTGMQAADGSFPWLTSAPALATWAAADALGLVMDLMTVPPGKSSAAIKQVMIVAMQYPRVRIVLDHVAWPDAEGRPEYGIDASHRLLAQRPNIYYKFTTINLDFLRTANVPATDALRHIVDVYGAQHVLWGSDIGNSAGLYSEMVSRIVAATTRLSERERRDVLHDTGNGVFVRGGIRG